MKTTLGVEGANQNISSQSVGEGFPDILNLLAPTDREIQQFNLGDELAKESGASGDIYLVCFGRVRLLVGDPSQKREVCAVVLEAGETFGGDSLFCPKSFAYRAIAAGTGQVAKISRPVEKLPEVLRDRAYSQAQMRSALMFFKTATELRALNAQQLRELWRYILAKRIAPGDSLAVATPSNAGRYWLASGKLTNTKQTLEVGSTWGYPDTTLVEGTAETEVWVYQLPVANWSAAAAYAPGIIQPQQQEPGTKSGDRATQSRRGVRPAKQIALDKAQPEGGNQTATPTTQNDFPKNQKSEPQSTAPTTRKPPLWPNYAFIQQQSTADCGAACLGMVSQYWGKRYSLNYLRNIANVAQGGASLKNLASAAENLGYHARPVRASLDPLAQRKTPWIAHWQGNHWVVVYQVNKKNIQLADPAAGRRRLTRKDFLANWTGHALLLDPTEKFGKVSASKSRGLGSFWGMLWPYSSLLWQIIFTSLLIQIFGLITPLFTQVILDQVVVNKSLPTLHVFTLGLILFSFWSICLSSTRQYLLDYLSNRFDLSLISSFISHALSLPLQFFASRHVGDIITRVHENQKIQLFLTRQAVSTWLDALMVFVYLGLMAYYNLQLTLLVIGLIPPIVLLTVVATPFLKRISREIFTEEAKQNSALVETINGVAAVKVAAAEREVRWRWEELLTSSLNARFRGQKLGNNLQTTSGFIQKLGNAALLWYGALLVIQDQLTIGQFVAFNMMIGNVISPVMALVKMWDEFQEVLVSVERLNDVFEAEPEEPLVGGTGELPMLRLPPVQGDVRFENVTFRYSLNEERNTLQNLSFEVEAGQTVAIVGRSGSGKSTLVSLLQSLYHPTTGRVLVDGHDIKHVSPSSWRSQLGVVPQECFLFSGTIMENITLFSEEYSLEQVVEVAKLAEAHPFIQDLPLGYQTKVGERGSTLSGGQRQRIAIARALLGNPRVLILDEATSSLDTESEKRFQNNLARISRDRTTFIIAHRLSTVREADSILVVDKGVLVEQGNHEQLMSRRGLYYHLAQQQLDL